LKLREEILESQRVAIIRKKKIFHQKHREIFQEELLRTQVREREKSNMADTINKSNNQVEEITTSNEKKVAVEKKILCKN